MNAETPAMILEREMREIAANNLRDEFKSRLTNLESPLTRLDCLGDLVAALVGSPNELSSNCFVPIQRELERIHDEMLEAWEGAWAFACGKAAE